MSPGPVTMHASGVECDVQAWPTGTPGLVVVRIPEGVHAGRWRVGHARSGRALPYCLPDPEAALSLARALDGITDWQQLAPPIRAVMTGQPYKAAVERYRDVRCTHGRVDENAMLHDNGVIA